jgi:two-component system, NtrC family, nitrogen regulation sensor histidine kinase NtrY
MAAASFHRIRFQKRVTRDAWLLLLTPTGVIVLLLWVGDFSLKVWVTSLTAVAVTSLFHFRSLLISVFRPVQSATNLVAAIREGDFSMQVHRFSTDDALGELYQEIHLLMAEMRAQNLRLAESRVLLSGVMDHTDVAIYAFDQHRRLTLANRAGCALLQATASECVGKQAGEYGMDVLLTVPENQPFEHTFPNASGRWNVRRREFREGGVPHVLVLLQDLRKSLRQEERLAWRRLIRVMGHELHNSLAPIKSISGTLETLVVREMADGELKDDLQDGLHVIQKRADALSRFVGDYARIAKLPEPVKRRFSLNSLVGRILELHDFKGSQVCTEPCGEVELWADEGQIEQLLINITKNAIEANQATHGNTLVRCHKDRDRVIIEVLDEGLGLASSDNLFTPFYSTKSGGSGIGLTLSRQIAENHDGSLELMNRSDRRGCMARVVLPLEGSSHG